MISSKAAKQAFCDKAKASWLIAAKHLSLVFTNSFLDMLAGRHLKKQPFIYLNPLPGVSKRFLLLMFVSNKINRNVDKIRNLKLAA